MFSNGRELFAYHDRAGYNGLCFTYPRSPFPKISRLDEDWNVDLTEEKRPSEQGFLLATRALTDEPWVDLRCGGLLVLRSGEPVYGDPRA